MATSSASDHEQLKLVNQLCFPFYAVSRLITRQYQPHLDVLGLTYPQYLVLMVLWEKDGLKVKELAHRLILNTNTLTPLLKRLESSGLLSRQRDATDERVVKIYLTEEGKALREKAAGIPAKMLAGWEGTDMSKEELQTLRRQLQDFAEALRNNEGEEQE